MSAFFVGTLSIGVPRHVAHGPGCAWIASICLRLARVAMSIAKIPQFFRVFARRAATLNLRVEGFDSFLAHHLPNQALTRIGASAELTSLQVRSLRRCPS